MPAKRTLQAKAASGASITDTITRFWVTALVIAAILYAAALLVSRTDGFKGLVRERLEKLSGMDLEIDSVKLSPTLNLVVMDIAEAAPSNSVSRLRVGRADLDWKFMALIRGRGWPFRFLGIEDAVLRFVNEDGEWSPLPLIHGALYPWAVGESAEPSGVGTNADNFSVSGYLRSAKAKVRIRDAALEWYAEAGHAVPVTSVSGISLSTEPVRPMDERVLWCELHVDRAVHNGNIRLDRLDIEWVRMKDRDVLLRSSTESTNPPLEPSAITH